VTVEYDHSLKPSDSAILW